MATIIKVNHQPTGGKEWVAEITGRHPKFGLNREFQKVVARNWSSTFEIGGAEVYSIATKADQSRIIFSEAVHMVKQSPVLSKFIKKRQTDMYMPITFSKMALLASESKSLDGLNSHCVIIDELHAIRDRNLYDVIQDEQFLPVLYELDSRAERKANYTR